jgi:environmental stress-induced protein Ves
MIHLPRSSYTLKPWKNGLGLTEEIYVSPDTDGEFLFRVSMAALSSSGPFSFFPGVDRTLILLEGNPVRLNDRLVPLLTPVNFAGEEKIVATVEAEGRDLNLMCRRGRVSGKIHVLSQEAVFSEGADFCLIFALSESVKVGSLLLKKYDSCFLGSLDRKNIIKGNQFLRIDIYLIDQ